MSSWNLLGKDYEKIPLLGSANRWGVTRAHLAELMGVFRLNQHSGWFTLAV
jgi:hypothetical protein